MNKQELWKALSIPSDKDKECKNCKYYNLSHPNHCNLHDIDLDRFMGCFVDDLIGWEWEDKTMNKQELWKTLSMPTHKECKNCKYYNLSHPNHCNLHDIDLDKFMDCLDDDLVGWEWEDKTKWD